MTDDLLIAELRRHIMDFTWLLEAKLDECCGTQVCMLEFRLLHHVVDDFEQFGRLETFNALLSQRPRLHIK